MCVLRRWWGLGWEEGGGGQAGRGYSTGSWEGAPSGALGRGVARVPVKQDGRPGSRARGRCVVYAV